MRQCLDNEAIVGHIGGNKAGQNVFTLCVHLVASAVLDEIRAVADSEMSPQCHCGISG